jgi:ABC-2 type transport system ATP-binding protein
MLAVNVVYLSHTYPPTRRSTEPHRALENISLQIKEGELFALLGPNGSGKSTLFKILSTLIKPTEGRAEILGFDVVRNQDNVRQHIGVVFQNPSLDKKLTVKENLTHQGHLYNLRGTILQQKIDAVLSRVGLMERKSELVEHLSGGMQRRVEIAKGLLHQPRVLLLDEPSTGLDPGARIDLMHYLHELQKTERVTIVLTTHILDEAEHCERIAILDEGKLVALDTPQRLKEEIGGEVVTIHTTEAEFLQKQVQTSFRITPQLMNGMIRLELPNGHEFVPKLIEAFPGKINSVTVSKPTLEDVFIRKTGHRFWNEQHHE